MPRYNRAVAAKVFGQLWPDRETERSVAHQLADSIRVAHQAGENCWSVTLFENYIRMNVGQVEVLTFSSEQARLFFQSPIDVASVESFELSNFDQPIFKSVPVPSGVCRLPVEELNNVPTQFIASHELYIRTAASFKSRSPFRRSFSPSVLQHIEALLGIELPRPTYAPAPFAGEHAFEQPEEICESETYMEGAVRRVVVNAYERDRKARERCIREYGLACAACGMKFSEVYGSFAAGFIHVHHLKPLSEIGKEYKVDPVTDLRPVCPNCHAVMHMDGGPESIEDLKRLLEVKCK